MTKLNDFHVKRSPLVRHAVAVIILLLALLLRLSAMPVESGYPFITFFPTMVACFYLCGIGPGVLFVTLSAGAGYWIFTPPLSVEGDIVVALYVIAACLVGFIISQLQDYAQQLNAKLAGLRQSEECYDELVRRIPVGIYTLRLRTDGTVSFLYASQKFCQMLGLSEQDVLEDAESVHGIIHPDDRASLEESNRLVAQTLEPFRWEGRYQLNGETRWLRIESDPTALSDVDSLWSGAISDITERKRAVDAVQASEEFLREMSRVAKVGGWNLDLTTRKLTWTEEVYRIREVDSNYQPELEDGIHCYAPAARPVLREAIERAVTQGTPYDLELPFITAKGNHLWVRTIGNADRVNGQTVRLYGVFQDITERKQTEEAVRDSEVKFKALADTSLLAIYMSSGIEQKYEYINPTAVRLFGYTLDETPTVEQWWPLAYPDETYRRQIMDEWQRKIECAIAKCAEIEPMEVVVTCKDGSHKNILWGYKPIGETSYAFGLDLTERKRLEEKLLQQAITDELTGITNRRHFLELADTEIKRALRLRRPLAIALIDMDDFKHINDSYGHATGDQALLAFTKICLRNIREIDLLARFGGDEFVLLLPEIRVGQAYEVVERVRLALASRLVDLGGKRVAITISSGISTLAGAGESLDSLLERADEALYQAKEAGRNRVVVAHAAE